MNEHIPTESACALYAHVIDHLFAIESTSLDRIFDRKSSVTHDTILAKIERMESGIYDA